MADTLVVGGRTASTDRTTWEGEMTALEARAEIDSLDDLHAQRRALVEANAALIARYGSFGMHDDYRKSFVETQKVRARLDLSKSDTKVTEARIDAEAYGSDAYADFLDNALNEKVAYLKVQTQIDELNERIRNRELSILAFNAEARLAR